MSMGRRILVVGASLAGLRAAEQIRQEGFEGSLTILGAEPHRPYDRPPLSKALLAGKLEPQGIGLRAAEGLNAEWILGDPAAKLNLARRTVITGSGRGIGFDGLVIATGSVPRRLRGIDPDAPGIFELRTLDQAVALRDALARRPRLAIVGAGFIGIEVASTARDLGVDVVIVSPDPPLAAAGGLVSSVVAEQLRDHGVELHLGRTVSRVEGGVDALVLDDGTRIDADVVLVAVGAIPATGWLAGSGLWLDRGVLCDSCCAALGAHGIVAAGDVARWAHPAQPSALRVEHWTNAVEQAIAAARTLMRGRGRDQAFAPVPSFWSDHFGTRVQSVGFLESADRFEIVEGDVEQRRFAATAYRGETLVGAVAYGLPAALLPVRARLADEVSARVSS
jgi:3-phenylpropionate/trans-cinnamate dioxygenase ferredoxin reductase component